MNAKERTKKHFDETAADYDQSADGKFVQPMYAALVEEIERVNADKLLDIGCGTGNLFAFLKNETPEIYGVDLSEKMIEVAQEKYANRAKLFVSDAEKLPFENEMFDILVCNASFHHYTQPHTVLDEMSRVAKPNCTLLIGDPYSPQPFRGLANFFTKYSDGGDYHYYGVHEMTKLLAAHGFIMSDTKRTSNHSILFIAKKEG